MKHPDPTPTPPDAAAEQARLWNGSAGQAWVTAQPILDALFAPLTDLLVAHTRAAGAGRVLDVGCGTGAVTLAIAAQAAPDACLGVDVSAPMVALARARGERAGSGAQFVCADAQTHPFAAASFDRIVSRFGVMFFGDPVAALTNLRRAASATGTLCCIAWRGAEANPFMTAAERAAAPCLPDLPARRPDGPGQFAFADRERVATILARSGWRHGDVAPIDVPCAMPADQLDAYGAMLGPVARALETADPALRARVAAAVREGFAPFVSGGMARFPAACWLVTARTGS